MDPPPPHGASSILNTLGSEILGVMSPVSICMLVVVLLVALLSPHQQQPSSNGLPPPSAATLVYQESPSDSTSKKLEGALLNSLVFVLLVAGVTFLLLLLYYYNFTNLLRNYMRFSAFVVLSSLGGPLILSLLRLPRTPLDAPTFLLLLLNLSSLGVLSISASAFPIILRQSYMVALGVIVAAYLTKLPEWTTWCLLLSLAIYDLVAVLAPGGPLKLLVQLASSREDDLPAFVYEARPHSNPLSSSPLPSVQLATQYPSRNSPISAVNFQVEASSSAPQTNTDVEEAPLVPHSVPLAAGSVDEDEEEQSSRGIKLGLGDFVFYSVLVGRAAMYDWMTVYACYLAVVAGLACTLMLLSVFRKALPALPISITLGVVFYFLTRLLLEPLVVGMSTSLVMF